MMVAINNEKIFLNRYADLLSAKKKDSGGFTGKFRYNLLHLHIV